jgi:arabinan endo-1,5-alpha-L-arabinosidase
MLLRGLLTAVLVSACGPETSATPLLPDPATAPAATPTLPPATATVPPASSAATATISPELASRILDTTGFTTPVHDPVMARDGDRYYLFSTGPGVSVRCSNDMSLWEPCGNVFPSYPDWVRRSVPNVKDLWAPDISLHDGRFYLYYSASSFGSNESAIGLATNVTLDRDSPDYEWLDHGEVISSRKTDDHNAIDPNLFVDQEGQAWLSFGSFWTGIKLVKLDRATGKPSADAPLISVADNAPQPQDAIEAPFITQRGDFYYLFVSHDFCCRGVNSTYNIRVGRSSDVTGPYVDREGSPMIGGGGTLVYGGSDRWRGPGHNAIYIEDDTYYLIFHSYDAKAGGTPTLRIEKLIWDEDDWPISPSAMAGM